MTYTRVRWLEVAEWIDAEDIDDVFIRKDGVMWPIKNMKLNVSELRDTDWYLAQEKE